MNSENLLQKNDQFAIDMPVLLCINYICSKYMNNTSCTLCTEVFYYYSLIM